MQAIFNTAFLLLLFVPTYLMGWLDQFATPPSVYFNVPIILMFMYGLYIAGKRNWLKVVSIGEVLVTMGLLGTMVGFIVAFGGIDPTKVSSLEYVKAMVGSLLNGMGIAIQTTLISTGCFGWLLINMLVFNEDKN